MNDERVAAKVFGYPVRKFGGVPLMFPRGIDNEGEVVPPYTTNPGAAWSIVERMDALGWYVIINNPAPSMGDDTYWQAAFYDANNPEHRTGKGVAKTMPEAVTTAALAALGDTP